MVLWGLNRMDLKDSLIVDYNKSHNENIKDVDYDKDDLINLYKFLIEKCNKNLKLEVNKK